ncbi:hypothetical protein QJQ45_014583 [Haematococcus lacustris]|nr:hypothetical protein QJQ45_014583 [Haematococcus lacustris]
MESNVLDADLLRLSPGLMLEALKVTVEKIACPSCMQHGDRLEHASEGGASIYIAAPSRLRGLAGLGAVLDTEPQQVPVLLACAAQCPNLRRCVVQVVKAHPSVVKRGEVTLECDDGGLSVLRDVFVVSSPRMADLLGNNCTSVKVSGSTKEEWLLVISQLYPIVPRPELSLQQLQQVLPVVHKVLSIMIAVRFHNFPELLQYVESRLATQLASTWSLDPSAPGYIIKWLVTAEQLQLDALKQAALEGLKKQPGQQFQMRMESNVLDADLLLLSPGLMLEAWKVTVEKKVEKKDCPSCLQQCNCNLRSYYIGGSMCSTCAHCPNFGRCLVQVMKAQPSVVKRGEVTLECDNGGLAVLRGVFVLSSPWMADLMGEGCTTVKVRGRWDALCPTAPCRSTAMLIPCAWSCRLCSFQVPGSTKEEWLLVISQLYPIVPRPGLSLQQLQQVLLVVHNVVPDLHKYVLQATVNPHSLCCMHGSGNEHHGHGGGRRLPLLLLMVSSLPCISCLQHNFPELLQYVESRLVTKLASTWSLDPSAPGYIIKWLVTAEQLQLDALKQAALEGLNLSSDVLDDDLLLLSPGLMLEALKVTVEKIAQCPNLRRCVVQVVKAHPSVVKRGEVTLECDDGGLSVLRDVFVVSSPRMADLLGNNCTSVKVRGCWDAHLPMSHQAILCACVCPLCSLQVSGSTNEEWLLVISQLNPIVPRPELSLQQLQQVLPVVHKASLDDHSLCFMHGAGSEHHDRSEVSQLPLWLLIVSSLPCISCLQYNLTELLQFVSSRLATQLASTWSLDPSAPGYIIKWLVTAEQLQLDALKQAALEGLKKQPGQQFQMRMESNVLDADLLLLSPGLMLEALKVTVEKKVEKKDCPSCLQQCNCNLRSYYIGGSMCSTCGKRRCCGNCGKCYSP